jgi:hypothetical protein
MMWTPDKELEDAALHAIDAELGELASESAEARASSSASLLEAVGTLVACERRSLAIEKIGETARDALRAELQRLELPELDDASLRILESAPLCLTMDESSLDEVAEPIVDALRSRDRAELLWMGADALGLRGALSAESQATRDSFDALIAPELWQLLPLGARRSVELQWMAPTQRTRFWWRARGAELGEGALEDRAMRDIVLTVFPEARVHLEAFDAMTAEPRHAPVELRTLFSRKAQAHARSASGQPRALAAGGSPGANEVPVLRTSVVEVGFVGATIVVDVIADLVAGGVPELVGPERIAARAVPDTAQRFTIELSDSQLARAGWRLMLPLELGRVEIPLDGDAD